MSAYLVVEGRIWSNLFGPVEYERNKCLDGLGESRQGGRVELTIAQPNQSTRRVSPTLPVGSSLVHCVRPYSGLRTSLARLGMRVHLTDI